MRYSIVLLFLITSMYSDIKIYVSKESPIDNITKQDLKNLYLKKTKIYNGKKIEVLDNKASYEKFCKVVLNKSPNQIHAYWMKQIFLGKNTPPKKVQSLISSELKSDKSIISYSENYLDAKVVLNVK